MAQELKRGRPPIGTSDGGSAGTITLIATIAALGFAAHGRSVLSGLHDQRCHLHLSVHADWRFGDWQSPVMSMLWWLIDPIAPGAWSMFLLIASFYWLGFGLMASRWRAVRMARRVVPLLAFVPPAFLFARHDLARHSVRRRLAARRRARYSVADRGGARASWRAGRALVLVGFGVLLRPNASSRRRCSRLMCSGPTRFECEADGDPVRARRSRPATR